MAIWYDRESTKEYKLPSQAWYKFYAKKPKQDTFIHCVEVCPKEFEKAFPKSMHLDPGKGPYKLKPLERA